MVRPEPQIKDIAEVVCSRWCPRERLLGQYSGRRFYYFWSFGCIYIAMRQRAGHNIHGEKGWECVYTKCNVCSLPDIILVCPFNSASHNFSHSPVD